MQDVKNAGAIFVGEYATVAFGDYFIGPSHTLPTNFNARFTSGLSVNTFLKRSAVMRINKNAQERHQCRLRTSLRSGALLAEK